MRFYLYPIANRLTTATNVLRCSCRTAASELEILMFFCLQYMLLCEWQTDFRSRLLRVPRVFWDNFNFLRSSSTLYLLRGLRFAEKLNECVKPRRSSCRVDTFNLFSNLNRSRSVAHANPFNANEILNLQWRFVSGNVFSLNFERRKNMIYVFSGMKG